MVGPAVRPPSIPIACATIKDISSDAIDNTAVAISSACARLPIGCASAFRLAISELTSIESSISVSTVLGQTALMRMPLPIYSSAAERVRPMTPCFAAE